MSKTHREIEREAHGEIALRAKQQRGIFWGPKGWTLPNGTPGEYDPVSPPEFSRTVVETDQHYPEEREVETIVTATGKTYTDDVTFCARCGEVWPCHAALVPHVPDGQCYACNQKILVQIFKGDLWCSDDCQKRYLQEFGDEA